MSTNPDDALDRLAGELGLSIPQQAGGGEAADPEEDLEDQSLDSLLQDLGGGDEPEREDEEGLGATGALLESLQSEEPLTRPPEFKQTSSVGAFSKGLAEEALSPLTLFGVEGPDFEIDRPIAESIGRLAGFGVGFAPFLGATRLGLKGVGLLKGMDKVGTARAAIEHGIEGGIAFGAFEAGRAEDPGEAAERFAHGALFGAIGDAALMGTIAAFRNRAAKTLTQTFREGDRITDPARLLEPAKLEPGKIEPVKIGPADEGFLFEPVRIPSASTLRPHPDHLHLERQLNPGNSVSLAEVAQKVRDIGDPDKALEQTAAKIGMLYRPGGQLIIPGIRSRDKVVPALIRNLPEESQVLTRRTDDDLFEILIMDSLPRQRAVAEVSTTAVEAETKERYKTVFLGEKGERAVSSWEEALRFAQLEGGFNLGQKIRLTTLDELADGGVEGLQTTGKWEPSSGTIWVADDVSSESRKMQTLFHELAHNFHEVKRVQAGRNIKDFESLFPHLSSKEVLGLKREAATLTRAVVEFELRQQGRSAVAAKAGALDQVYGAMREFDAKTWDDFLINAQKAGLDELPEISDAVKYHQHPAELFSFGLEGLYLKPSMAENLASNFSREVARLIQDESPKLTTFLSRTEREVIDTIVRTYQEEAPKTIFTRAPIRMSDEMLQQWEKTGNFRGQSVLVDGKEMEFVARAGKGDDGVKRVIVRDPDRAGRPQRVDAWRVQRPTMAKVAKIDTKVKNRTLKALKGGPGGSVGVALRQGDDTFRGYADIRNYERTDDLGRWVSENAPNADIEINANQSLTQAIDNAVVNALREQGKPGLLLNEDGAYKLYVGDGSTIKLGRRLGGDLDGPIDRMQGNVIDLSFDNVAKGILREQGVSERDMPYFLDTARRVFADDLENLMEGQVKTALEGAREALKRLDDNFDDAVSRAGFRAEELTDGTYRLVDPTTRTEVAAGLTPDEILDYARRAGPSSSRRVAGGSRIPDEGAPTGGGVGGPPKPPGSQPRPNADPSDHQDRGFGEKLIDAFSIFFKNFTSMETFAKTAERNGLGPAWSKVFDPMQKAMRDGVDGDMAQKAIEMLGGKTFQKNLREIRSMARGMTDDAREQVTQYLEFMTKGEVASEGGLLRRGMNNRELRFSNIVQKLGLAEDLPRLQSTQRLVRQMLNNKEQFRASMREMATREIQDPGLEQTLSRLNKIADDTPDSFDGALEALNMTDEERTILNLLDVTSGTSPEELSWFAVGRHARAPELPEGFSSGRQWFAQANGFSGQQKKLAERLEEHLGAVFAESGLNERRQIGGYWPHVRKYKAAGMTEETLRRELPDSYKWSHNRLRTGELDVYERDPISTTYKYTRGLLMSKHVDPIMGDVKDAVKAIKQTDPGVGKVMDEYVNEILGRPHVSWTKLEESLRRSMGVFGVEVPEGLPKKIVNNLLGVTYGATIPFRPALIARNFYQMAQTIVPRVGPRDFFASLGDAFSQEGRRMAQKADVIPPNTQPLFAGETLDRPGQIFDLLNKMNERVEKVFRKGFDWYRSADDIGRAAAFHSQRRRIDRFAEDYFNNKIGYNEFKKRAKVKTFDELDEREFDRLWQAGQYEEAKNHLGRALARETIFRYGHANHPAGWGGIAGRMFGQFGTWPVQYKDFLLQGARRGTTKDKAEFLALHGITNVATVAGGATVGIDMWNWVTFPSLQYTGGPFADIALNTAMAVGGSGRERQMALNSLKFQFPTIEDGRSIFIPGSYAAFDFAKMFTEEPTEEAIMEGLGFNIMRPGETDFMDLFD